MKLILQVGEDVVVELTKAMQRKGVDMQPMLNVPVPFPSGMGHCPSLERWNNGNASPVVQENEGDKKRLRLPYQSKTFKGAACLFDSRLSHNDPKNFADVGGGVLGRKDFHSSFRGTQGGLSLNIDVSTTMIVQPGPVVDFLIANQNVRDPYSIDWAKAKRMLKNLRIKATTSN